MIASITPGTKIIRSAAIAACAAVGVGTLLAVPAASAQTTTSGTASHSVRDTRASQHYTWVWTDGSDQTKRYFAESDYGIGSNLPRIKVRSYPSYPQRRVSLSFWQNGSWHRESSNMTNSRGVAVLKLNPYASSGHWANGTWKYRLTVSGSSAYKDLWITYRHD